jgi:hypothetical protein
MEKCKFYQKDTEEHANKEIRDTRSRLEPLRVTDAWCSHDDSPLRKNEKGDLDCQGDLKVCPIVKELGSL